MSVLDSIGNALGTAWDQNVNGVYNPLGREIGYWQNLPDLSNGVIMVFTGETAGDPSTWTVKNALGVDTNAGDWLLSQGLTPIWATPAQVAQAQTNLTSGGLIGPLANFQLPSFSLPSLSSAVSGDAGKLALMGGVGILALVLILRRK